MVIIIDDTKNTVLCCCSKLISFLTVTLKIVSEVATHINESMKKMVSDGSFI